MNTLFDERTECWSIQTTMTVGEYLNLILESHSDRGALHGQRDVLTTTTAKRIRDRMVSDIQRGAVLPPIVVGSVTDERLYEKFGTSNLETAGELVAAIGGSTLSIIDGMQRTAAIKEAVDANERTREKLIRVEFWIARNVRALIYRMLVLNTGQVPWTISRQLTVVYGPLLQELQASVPEIDKVITPDQPGRRVAAAQYSSDDLVELYIAFSLRKTAVDTKGAVSDEFSRLDFVENLSAEDFQSQFYETIRLMARLDKSFSRCDKEFAEGGVRGRTIFDRQPARIGLIVSIGTMVLGRPGADRIAMERNHKMDEVSTQLGRLIDKIDSFSASELADFLRLEVLNEVLDKRVGQVGRYERSVFSEAFKVLLAEGDELVNMEPCWRAE